MKNNSPSHPSKGYLNRGCPNCKNYAGDVSGTAGVVANIPAEDLTFADARLRFIGFSHGQTFFSYFRCSECGLLYCPVFFSHMQLDELYASMPDNSDGEDIEILAKTQSGYSKKFFAGEENYESWLDLGADIGLFSIGLRKLCPQITIDAVEPNEDVHALLRESIGPSGRISTSWETQNSTEYSGISAIHVLDHLVDLQSDLGKIVAHLAVGGTLVAVVHNERSMLRRILRNKWPPFCLQHPQLFSPMTLESTLEQAGLEVVGIHRTFNYFSIRHLVKVALGLVALPTSWSRAFPKVAIPLPLGNILVVARKNC